MFVFGILSLSWCGLMCIVLTLGVIYYIIYYIIYYYTYTYILYYYYYILLLLYLIMSYTILFLLFFLSFPLFSSSLPLPILILPNIPLIQSIRVGVYCWILISPHPHPNLSFTGILTPHVLSEWMVEVCDWYLYVFSF